MLCAGFVACLSFRAGVECRTVENMPLLHLSFLIPAGNMLLFYTGEDLERHAA